MFWKLRNKWRMRHDPMCKVLTFIGEDDKNALRILKRMTKKEGYKVLNHYRIESGLLYVLTNEK